MCPFTRVTAQDLSVAFNALKRDLHWTFSVRITYKKMFTVIQYISWEQNGQVFFNDVVFRTSDYWAAILNNGVERQEGCWSIAQTCQSLWATRKQNILVRWHKKMAWILYDKSRGMSDRNWEILLRAQERHRWLGDIMPSACHVTGWKTPSARAGAAKGQHAAQRKRAYSYDSLSRSFNSLMTSVTVI